MPYLPPETIANYLGSGPGPASMRLVSRQWGLLGREIMDLESKFNHMLACLTAKWSGPVGQQVIDAAQPFQSWLHDLVAELFAATCLINSIVAAYRRAYYSVIPTAQINANRTQRAQLLANDPLGQYAHEIAQLDQQYERFLVLNGQVWDRYRSQLSAASKLTPFPSPPPIANDTGLVTLVSEPA